MMSLAGFRRKRAETTRTEMTSFLEGGETGDFVKTVLSGGKIPAPVLTCFVAQ